MFGNTLVLPHADGDITLVKVNQDQYSSEYRFRNTLMQVTAKIRHATMKKAVGSFVMPADRHNVEVSQEIYATDTAAAIFRKFYVVLEQMPSDTDVKLVDSLCDWLIASAGANITSLQGWES